MEARVDDRESRLEGVLAAFRQQVEWCERLGSPFTAELLRHLAQDIETGGIVAELAGAWAGDPVADALALRFAGALHALVLTGAAAELAALYPPQTAAPAEMGAVLLRAVEQHRDFIGSFLISPPQTNEVGRSAVLLGGFLTIAREFDLPLHLLEIGASAGLNTNFERYHYRLGEAQWGDPASPVHLAPAWQGPLPPLEAPLRVAARRACDIAPIDLEDAGQRLRLKAYVWADQRERLSRLEGAIAEARSRGVNVEQEDAATWLRARLQEPAEDCASVLFHSIMWQYLPAATQADIEAAMSQAGNRATGSAPLAWLRFEPPQLAAPPRLRLTLWPGGRDLDLAVAQPHGSEVVWSGG